MTPTVTAIGLALAAALAYAVSCYVWPFTDCWLCKGNGHHRPDSNRKLSRPCRWCKATGKRLRIGRRVANAVRDRRRAGI